MILNSFVVSKFTFLSPQKYWQMKESVKLTIAFKTPCLRKWTHVFAMKIFLWKVRQFPVFQKYYFRKSTEMKKIYKRGGIKIRNKQNTVLVSLKACILYLTVPLNSCVLYENDFTSCNLNYVCYIISIFLLILKTPLLNRFFKYC